MLYKYKNYAHITNFLFEDFLLVVEIRCMKIQLLYTNLIICSAVSFI